MEPPGTEEIHLFLRRLALPSPAETDTERIDRLRAMERVKNALAAAQASEAVAFEVSQRNQQIEAGWGAHRIGRGIADQIAMARMESPHKGSRLLRLARALAEELPHCRAALQRGEVSEWRVTCVARETAHLRVEDRKAVDAELGPRLHEMGDRQCAGAARALAHRLDPTGAALRAARAERDRRVSIRPAPESMTYLTALLPMRDGVTVFAALTRLATDTIAAGDGRAKGQVMADTLIERVTGRAMGAVPVTVNMVMTDTTLLGGGSTPVGVPGLGSIPAGIARTWIRATCAAQVVPFQDLVSVRRLFTSPQGRDLVAMESTQRAFTGLLRHMVELRDQTCRTPWCDATIRHVDHVQRREDQGPTDYRNGRGTCERCNHAREAPGWHATVTGAPGARHEVTLTTPTGHSYRSHAPPVIPGGQQTESGQTSRSRDRPAQARAG